VVPNKQGILTAMVDVPPKQNAHLQEFEIARHKTAMKRYALSRPLALAMAHRLIEPSRRVLDYGCGRGADVRLLGKAGVIATGWDPHFRPDEPLQPAECVNLGYVLNVIENLIERRQTLQKAFALAEKVLIVSVRVDQSLGEAPEFADGVLTKVGSFQKLYSQQEFRDYLRETLGHQPHMASLGVAYVFKDLQAESDYLARLSLFRPVSFRETVRTEFSKDRTAQRYIAMTKELGRVPLLTEFKALPRLLDRYGSLQRIERIAESLIDGDALVSTREEKRSNFLTYIAMLQLQGLTPPPIRMLPEEVQADIKMLWPSYKTSIQAGTDFLFELGKPGAIQQQCKQSLVGKKLPDSLYVHHTAEGQLSPLLRLMILAARQIVGDLEYDLIKIALDGKKLSFLRYPDFEDSPHPELAYSVRVFLPTASYGIKNFSDSDNPPILHRKETFVDAFHPRYAEFAELSAQEEALGLLGRTDIGTRKGWQAALQEKGLQLVGHSVITATGTHPNM
jgi:DNA phosphorothioation-associated putative methyltransferase